MRVPLDRGEASPARVVASVRLWVLAPAVVLMPILVCVLAAAQEAAPAEFPDPGLGAVEQFRSGWVLPVQRPVVDGFRAPRTEWGPGNRGWEFASLTGDPVVAVGPGVVSFAGWVAGRGVVTVDHGGGLLSSVTGLSEVMVLRGRRVGGGQLLGRALPGLHLGFRLEGSYIDPALLYGRPRHAVLVPLPDGS